MAPGMVMTPMGPMAAPMAMQMGFGTGMMGGMDFSPHMMGMSHPMMNMDMVSSPIIADANYHVQGTCTQ